jgi:hypothetical protein
MAATSWMAKQPTIIDGPRRIVYGSLEANSQTFKAGSPVYSNAGAITVAAVGDVPFLGIAMKDATNVTSGNVEIPVMLITGENTVACYVQDGSGNLEAANTTCVAGTAYDWEVDATDSYFAIDSSDTTNPKMVFLQAIYDVNGDATYQGLFKPLNTEVQAELE